MYWFLILFPLMIYPWGGEPYYTMPKTAYLQIFVLGSWLYIILKRKYQKNKLCFPNFKLEIISSIFLGLIIFSTIFSVNIELSLNGTEKRYEGWLTFFSYVSILLFSYRFIKEEAIENLIRGMVIVSIIVSLYGIFQHFLFDFLPRHSSKLATVRSYAFFDNPNFFGSYLVIMIMLAITLYLMTHNIKLLILYYLSITLAFIALIYSSTRSGWVGAFVAVGFLSLLLVLKMKHLWKRWTILLTTFVLLFLIINFSEQGTYGKRAGTVTFDTVNVLSNQSTGKEGSNRLFIWEKSLSLVDDYFWFGSGPDTLAEVFPATPEELEEVFGTSNIIVDKVHNEYLHMAVTLGVPTLVTYLLIVLIVFRKAFLAIKITQGRERIFLYGLISAVIGYLVQAFFNISVVTVAPFFWALLGITLAKAEMQLKTVASTANIPINNMNQSA